MLRGLGAEHLWKLFRFFSQTVSIPVLEILYQCLSEPWWLVRWFTKCGKGNTKSFHCRRGVWSLEHYSAVAMETNKNLIGKPVEVHQP